MSSYKEIVTKAVIGKGKKSFNDVYTITPEIAPTTVLGCWVINHNFKGYPNSGKIVIDGSFDVNIWYSYDNDTKTDVLKESQSYREVVRMRNLDDDVTGEQIIVRSLKQPTCSDISISNRSIHYTIEKELGIELVGDVKVKIEANEEEDPWDEIIDENSDDKLDDELNDDFIQENPI